MQFAGPKRIRPTPLQVDGLPRVDIVVISHNHYDHLDQNTIVSLSKEQPECLFCVPLGMKEWFVTVLEEERGRRVIEMDWGQELELDGRDWREETRGGVGESEGEGEGGVKGEDKSEDETEDGDATKAVRPPLTVVCVPCQHWCKRTPTDTNKCLWSSWILKTTNMTYFFGGDTGYCGEMFRLTGALYPVDFAAIPIGAYGTPTERWFHKPNHQSPEEAVQCHVDLRSRQSVGVHWGTFLLTGEQVLEPPKRLVQAVEEEGLDKESFVVLEHGETRRFDLVRSCPRVMEEGAEITL
jgi:N-acyl-phosphatidylethanolamine-hydrolysing phospholipase D